MLFFLSSCLFVLLLFIDIVTSLVYPKNLGVDVIGGTTIISSSLGISASFSDIRLYIIKSRKPSNPYNQLLGLFRGANLPPKTPIKPENSPTLD